jgi:hypothetical protein
MSSGRPYTRKTWLNRVRAVSIAVGNPFRGMRRQDLENRSMMVRIVVKPLEGGKSVI